MSHQLEAGTIRSKKEDFISLRPAKPEIPLDPKYWEGLRKEVSEDGVSIPEFGPKDLIDVNYFLERIPLERIGMKGRGVEMRIPSGGLPEMLNPYLRMLMFLGGEPIQLQFIAQHQKEHGMGYVGEYKGRLDPLEEDKYKVKEAPHLVHKYPTRVLFLITDYCAAFCRYCTRGREVGTAGPVDKEAIDNAIGYIRKHPEITEVIISGGDPFTLSKELFGYLIQELKKLEEEDNVDSIRFGSRKLIQTGGLDDYIYEGLEQLYNVNVMLHINHTTEITLQVKNGLDRIHGTGAKMYSQSVLLKGVNDSREQFKALFNKCQKYHVSPYIVYSCDETEWDGHFIVPFPEARKIFHRLPQELNGLAATGKFVVDVAGGMGKIPVEAGFWSDLEIFEDYAGNRFRMNEQGFATPIDQDIQVIQTPQQGEITFFDKQNSYKHGK